MTWLEELKIRCRISEVISRYVSINRQSSKKYSIRCPFHAEKTPSFSIDEEKNMFYCFGCKIAGDSIKFVQKIENISFMDACTKIASWYSISISQNQKQDEIHFMKDILEYCKNNLQLKRDAISYLHSRGLTDETISKYEIGWFPKQSEFFSFCSENQIKSQTLENIGIKKIVFLLEERIVFPIYSGRTPVAFGARYISSMDAKKPKYLNTAESIYFKKKEILYGYNNLDRKQQAVLLVEGYFDVCMCYQKGINAVAPLGTASSPDHVKKIWNEFEEVVVCFDGDNAGINATSKLALGCISEIMPGKILSFIDLPKGDDPASALASEKQILDLKVDFVTKIWQIFNPKEEKVVEMQIAKYNELLSRAKLIKDDNLRYAHVAKWKKMWFDRSPKKTKKYIPDNPIEVYQFILIYTIVYFPDILDRVCDYFMSLELSGKFVEFREVILSSKPIDKIYIDMIESLVNMFSLGSLSKIAPFVKDGDIDSIEKGWMEIFTLYSRLIDKEYKYARK